ncbi:aldehyde ferredoxin oxidoreductase family protein [Desulfobacula sp.]|uniref:aldehyde ferredoxin oxidoreductase family protein n=1 Tax=Desulfobacula sp. TaxID=2593537 RepID=UPI00261D18E3|nr:aldehyde ferredoxin oxidoreductase family protein [Desulfobacula sp.]
MKYGFMDKILRVNLTSGTTAIETIPEQWARDYLGGAGLATKYLFEEVPADTDPLGPDNKLIFMTGPLTGTSSASASRYSVVAKSPLTGLWGHGNSGGSFGPAMKRAGFDGFIIEGSSEIPVYLEILDGEVKLLPAKNLWGKTVPETEDILEETSDNKVTIASIGPGGENLVRYAAIMNNKHRAVGRTGMGAVMGSKKLKAIVCAGKAKFDIADPEKFKTTARRQIDFLDESMLKVGFEAFGTNMVSDMVNARGGYPTRNWQTGVFDDIEKVNSEALTNTVLDKGVSCFACPIACGRGTTIKEGKYAGKTGEGPEYESANTLGALCGVSDMNAITMANYLCNENGLDTISTGSTIAFALECYEKGILTKEMTHGLELKFGNADLVIDLVKKIAKREGIGDLLAEGSRIAAQKLGKNSSHFAMNVKGMELPAYDPRAAKICGLGYVTANRGGDHITAFIEGPTFIDSPFVLVDDSKIKDPFVADPRETKVVVDLENALTAFDAIGACKFMGMLLPASDYTELINYALGWDMDVDDFRRCGERIYNLARLYNAKVGMDRTHDTLPGRLMKDPLPEGPAKGMVIDEETLEMMKDAYYDFRGWDKTTGNPGSDKLLALGIQEDIAK